MIYQVDLPKRWDKDLAYLFGLLVGDGSLPKTKSRRPNGKYQTRYDIQFISNSLEFCESTYIPLFKRLFGLTPRKEIRIKKNIYYIFRIESKMIYSFLKERGYIVGRKAKIAKVPDMPKKYHSDFLAGLLDTDGGKKGNGFGLSTASDKLAKFCIEYFKNNKIPFNSCPWHYNNHTYHQIYVRKKDMQKILKTIPIKNKNKINFIKSYTPR